MRLVVGLGNPGEKYKNTRHNAGFIILDQFASTYGFSWEEDKKFQCLKYQKGDVLHIKPQAFMNESGEVVSSVSRFYKIPPENILVVHDDVDLDFGQIKFQKDKSSAGHRGIESIIEKLGTSNFWRFRVGIGRSANSNLPTEEWVLQEFTPDELAAVKNIKIDVFFKK